VHVIARMVRAPHRRDQAGSRSRSPSPFSRRAEYAALRRALALSLARADFRIIHLALHRGQLELIVEADDKHALARGMQGFQVCAAKRLNRSVRRRGSVFPDRYHMRILRTRRDVRRVIGGLPLAPTPARPETWLLQIELARAELRRADMARDQPRRSRRWIHTRADEDG
jgi:hypothetical protein